MALLRCPHTHTRSSNVAVRTPRLPRQWAERPLNEVANLVVVGMAAYSAVTSLLMPLVPLGMAVQVSERHPVPKGVAAVLGITASVYLGYGLWKQWRLTCKHGASVVALCSQLRKQAHQAAAAAGRPLAQASGAITLVVPSLTANAYAGMGARLLLHLDRRRTCCRMMHLHARRLGLPHDLLSHADAHPSALPCHAGGSVVMFSGLIGMLGEDKDALAWVMAHEFSHLMGVCCGLYVLTPLWYWCSKSETPFPNCHCTSEAQHPPKRTMLLCTRCHRAPQRGEAHAQAAAYFGHQPCGWHCGAGGWAVAGGEGEGRGILIFTDSEDACDGGCLCIHLLSSPLHRLHLLPTLV